MERKHTQLLELATEIPELMQKVLQATCEALGPDALSLMKEYNIDMDSILRFHLVAQTCTHRREDLALTIKQAATQLEFPQYRLKDIESGNHRSVRQADLRAYVKLLGLQSWFMRWRKNNRAVYESLASERPVTAPGTRKMKRARGRSA